MRTGLVYRKIILGFFALLLISSVEAIDDPTRPPSFNVGPAKSASTVNKGPRWVLRSTLVSPERRTAVINNRVVSLGDRVRGATVVEINSSRVRLQSGGAEITLVI